MKTGLKRIILNIQHRLNPLHVYCRLVERGLSKKSSLSICRYYEILIYSSLASFSIVLGQICTHGRSIVKMLLAWLCAVTLVLGVTGIAKAIPIEFTALWYSTGSEPATMLLLGSGLIGLSGFLRRKFKNRFTANKK
ncbi:MAG TPA: PEP-CTERM sorting domain-containing protein [Desulfobacterales bacterium]|nr:PEP-CTERM sorting domain-containing protein [Desulfobacterales bacterium]